MEMVIGIILLLSYVGLVVYAAKGGNLMVGFFIAAILWAVAGGMPLGKIPGDIIQKGADAYGSTAIVIIFGSWFGRVLVETGLVGAIIKKTVELGGDRPIITTALLAIVTALIFTGTYGVGTVIAIGLISLPIMLSLGVPKNVAVCSFTLSIGAGMFCNVALFSQFTRLFPGVEFTGPYLRFGMCAFAVQLVLTLAMLGFFLTRRKPQHNWAAQAPFSTDAAKRVPGYAFVCPLIPVVMSAFCKWPAVPSMILAIFAALLLTGRLFSPKKCLDLLLKTLYDGTAEVGLLIGMLIMIVIFSQSAAVCAPLIGKYIQPYLPQNTLHIALVFGLLGFLALFRGPLMFFGVGAATVAILNAMGVYSEIFMLMLILIPTVSVAMSTCVTQSWNLWAINFTKLEIRDFLKTGVVWGWGACFINLLIAVAFFG